MKDNRKVIWRYVITTVSAGLVVLLMLRLNGFWEVDTIIEKYTILADAFTIPGVLLIMISALIWVSSEGFFDGLSYAFSRVGSYLIPFYRKSLEHENYYDYKQRKNEKRLHGYSFLFFVGLAFFAVAIVFLCLCAQ